MTKPTAKGFSDIGVCLGGMLRGKIIVDQQIIFESDRVYFVVGAPCAEEYQHHVVSPRTVPNWSKLVFRVRSSNLFAWREDGCAADDPSFHRDDVPLLVDAYKDFLSHKIKLSDWASVHISPPMTRGSKIDKVWHIHLSSPQDYWEDTRLLTKGPMIAHMPIFLRNGFRPHPRLQLCIDMQRKLLGADKTLDCRFWPSPLFLRRGGGCG